jgi:hypothetical protein
MKICPKAASFSRVALYAILGISAATQAHAFFRGYDERPPPNGANGLTLNGLTLNGLTLNGLTLNGLTLNGLTLNGVSANGQVSQEIKLQSISLPNGERIELR